MGVFYKHAIKELNIEEAKAMEYKWVTDEKQSNTCWFFVCLTIMWQEK